MTGEAQGLSYGNAFAAFEVSTGRFYEASATSNMKFMMNGALKIGARDGATIE
jgi:starch phosphorylase